LKQNFPEGAVENIGSKKRELNWMSMEDGVERIRNELFAFHGARTQIYNVMQHTYQEAEKCSLSEIDYISKAYPLLVMPKQSPYLEILKVGYV
jgi:hypothetical protein